MTSSNVKIADFRWVDHIFCLVCMPPRPCSLCYIPCFWSRWLLSTILSVKQAVCSKQDSMNIKLKQKRSVLKVSHDHKEKHPAKKFSNQPFLSTSRRVAASNHVIGWDEARVIDLEPDKTTRWLKEAIWGYNTMNKDEGPTNYRQSIWSTHLKSAIFKCDDVMSSTKNCRFLETPHHHSQSEQDSW